MMSDLIKQSITTKEPKRPVRLGDWYWLSSSETSKKYHAREAPTKLRDLGCVSELGSNYVELTVRHDNHTMHVRILNANFWDITEPVQDISLVIANNLQHHKKRLSRMLAHFNGYAQELESGSEHLLPSPNSQGTTSVVSRPAYLIPTASTRTVMLPKLQERIKQQGKLIEYWSKVDSFSITLAVNQSKKTLTELDAKLANLALYTGTAENSKVIRDGTPAAASEKVHVFQRMLYMDEECLVDYEHGGMSITELRQFDKWLLKPDNLNRILPASKCVVAFQVRRHTKHRESEGLRQSFITIQLEAADKWTYLYVRNGERVTRFTFDEFEFGTSLFPNQKTYEDNEPLMARTSGHRIYETMTVREFESLKKASDEMIEKANQWEKDNPFSQFKEDLLAKQLAETRARYEEGSAVLKRELEATKDRFTDDHYVRSYHYNAKNPYDKRTSFSATEWEWKPFSQDNTHYDDIVKSLQRKADKFNKVALILQGIFDRTDALAPHNGTKLWTPESFNEAFVLVYDTKGIVDGQAPDLDAYIVACNAKADGNSVFIGQQDIWERHEADKYNERTRHNFLTCREKSHHTPEGNPGPTRLARCAKWKPRAKEATFRWHREIINYDSPKYGKKVAATITIPVAKLFNVSAYKLGDYKLFYNDHRTREKYLEWAPMLLLAEEYAAGNITATEPVKD